MKKIIIIAIGILSGFTANAQERVRKDTMKVDTSHVEKIRKMPMDTVRGNMPVKPLPPTNTDPNKSTKKQQPIKQ